MFSPWAVVAAALQVYVSVDFFECVGPVGCFAWLVAPVVVSGFFEFLVDVRYAGFDGFAAPFVPCIFVVVFLMVVAVPEASCVPLGAVSLAFPGVAVDVFVETMNGQMVAPLHHAVSLSRCCRSEMILKGTQKPQTHSSCSLTTRS